MKNKLLFAFLITYSLSYSQGQFGFSAGINSSSYKTDDLIISRNPLNKYITINFLSYLTKTSDLIAELGYETGEMDMISYRDFNKNEVAFNTSEVKTSKFFLQTIYNQYIIAPESSTFHISIQGGLGTSIFTEWEIADSSLFDNNFNFTPYYIAGLSGGTEQLRFGLRFQKTITNPLNSIYVNDIPDQNNLYNQRQYKGSLSVFSISLTYYLEPFYN